MEPGRSLSQYHLKTLLRGPSSSPFTDRYVIKDQIMITFLKNGRTMNAQPYNPADRQDLKRQIRQLESIAALSGGIAHDYNNLLTSIMGDAAG